MVFSNESFITVCNWLRIDTSSKQKTSILVSISSLRQKFNSVINIHPTCLTAATWVRHKTCATAAPLQTSASSPWPWNWDTLLLKLQEKRAALETQKDEGLQIPWLLQFRESEWIRSKPCQPILMCKAGTAGLAVQPPWELGNCGSHGLGSGKALCLVADFWVHCFTTSYFLGFVTNRKRLKQEKNPHSRKLK